MKTTHKEPTVGCFSIILLIILTSCLLLAFGCTSTKHVDTASEVKEEVKVINTDSVVFFKIDSVREFYELKLKALDADVIFDNDCDTAYIDTGSVKVVNSIKYIPGKGFEATGNIKSFKLKETELLKTIDQISVQLEQEINLRVKAEETLKTELTTKKVDKKTSWFPWWLLIIAYAAGVFFPPMKIYNKSKSLFTKKIVKTTSRKKIEAALLAKGYLIKSPKK